MIYLSLHQPQLSLCRWGISMDPQLHGAYGSDGGKGFIDVALTVLVRAKLFNWRRKKQTIPWILLYHQKNGFFSGPLQTDVLVVFPCCLYKGSWRENLEGGIFSLGSLMDLLWNYWRVQVAMLFYFFFVKPVSGKLVVVSLLPVMQSLLPVMHSLSWEHSPFLHLKSARAEKHCNRRQ